MEIKIFFIIKVVVSALIIAIVTEVAKFSDKWGGLIAALPTTTFLILIWMYFEGASNKKIGNHIAFSLYFILPTLPMFLIFPFIINKFGFWIALSFGLVITGLLIFFFNLFYERFGVNII